ncbi:GNAT family N-acetyltransferase [Tellurirhabdus bombi]|uniref:GNAT family N-acetyltransferase n=1 Tax=Tellurirhabdus bombi TaxID=2907205 RepID=UPI001F1EE3FD|nr:GNAT family N-acetyltransferase [Tellurirhabdus bombi]
MNASPLDLIRLATAADTDKLLQLMDAFCRHFDYPFDEFTRHKLIVQLLETPSLGTLWLVEPKGEAVGYVVLTNSFTLEFGGVTAFVDELFIEAAWRGAGLGHQVLLILQQEARQMGFMGLHLVTEKYNTRAKQLYESLGFVDSERSLLTWLWKPERLA